MNSFTLCSPSTEDEDVTLHRLSEEKRGQAGAICFTLSSTGQIYTSQTDYIFGDITPGAVKEFLPATSSDLLNRSYWEGGGKTFEIMNALTSVSKWSSASVKSLHLIKAFW